MARRKYAPQKETIDAGSPYLARHFTIVPRLTNPTTMTMKNLSQTETDRMLLEDNITSAEHGTLNTLAKKLREFGYDDLRSPNYEGVISADPELVADRKADKIRGAVNLIAKMDKHAEIGRHRRKKLVNLALYEAPWGSNPDQIFVLKSCIRALDDIFIGRR